MSTVSQIEVAIQNIFAVADHLARTTGFVQRVQPGKLTGKSFAATQVLGLLVPEGGAMSDASVLCHPFGGPCHASRARSTLDFSDGPVLAIAAQCRFHASGGG